MYWVIDAIGGITATALQAVSSGGWVVVVGLCALLGYSGTIAWRRRHRSEAPAPASTTQTEPTPSPESAVLTDEERVLLLLESNGGRMHQTAIVEETEWSKSKVSMLLSEMEAEGSISKLRVGRENIISRPGFEPEATRSPLETGT